jgi:hypothetical protein
VYQFDTAISLLQLFELQEITKARPQPQPGADTYTPFPRGYTSTATPCTPLQPSEELDTLLQFDHVEWDEIHGFREDGCPQGEWGIIVAKRSCCCVLHC